MIFTSDSFLKEVFDTVIFCTRDFPQKNIFIIYEIIL